MSIIPLDVCVVDFESYYDREFSLSKMPTQQYVLDPRFRVHGAAIKMVRYVGRGYEPGPAVWHTPAELPAAFADIDWRRTAFCAHNAQFDGAIAAWHYGVRPAMFIDTLSMARAVVYAITGAASLAATAEFLGVGVKDTAVITSMSGRTLESLTPAELAAYKAYGGKDADLCWSIFERLECRFRLPEFILIDTCIRWFTDAVLVFDPFVIAEHLAEVQAKKAALLARVGAEDSKVLLSNDAFAGLLRAHGVDPPTKISPTTGKEVFAFAKTDKPFLELLEHPSQDIQALVAARLGVKSTQEETRSTRYLDLSRTVMPDGRVGVCPVPLRYAGAHTFRFSGGDKLNFQNLKRGSKLRKALRAPPGYKIVTADASQIEARINATLSGQRDLVNIFRENRDPYCEFGAKVYGRVITKADKEERFVCKTAVLGLGFGVGAETFVRGVYAKSEGKTILPIDEAKRIVRIWRDANPAIVANWKRMEDMLRAILYQHPFDIGPLKAHVNGIELPSGLVIAYHNLSWDPTGGPWRTGAWTYTWGKETRHLYGAAVTENCVQALARICTMDVIGRLRARWKADYARSVFSCHDELPWVVRDECAEDFLAELIAEMSIPPSWMPNLPLAAEGGIGQTYGDCK